MISAALPDFFTAVALLVYLVILAPIGPDGTIERAPRRTRRR